ncbi:unnamed protein product [Auanema sp. JU1783]|nr:unnamed protein product [Auanema sp. JU1783]
MNSVSASIPQANDRQSLDITKSKNAIFGKPQATVPTFELIRLIGNTVYELLYRLSFEKQYSREGLLNGANQGAVLLAKSFVSQNWNSIGNLTTEDLLARMKTERERFTDDEAQKFTYTSDDIVHSFLHSTLITGKKVFKISEQGNIGIYFTVVSYIRKNSSVPESIDLAEAVGKYKKDITAVNITFARTLNPLGVWKAVAFNMFELP